jgi:checkpoint serine/threonine-protein kinase
LHIYQTQSNILNEEPKPHPMREYQQAVNPRTGRLEVVFTDLRQVYPNADNPMAVEYSFEELRAKHRGWSDHNWTALRKEEQKVGDKQAESRSAASHKGTVSAPLGPSEFSKDSHKPQIVPLKGSVDDVVENDENMPPSHAELEKVKIAKKARREERANRTRKIKVMEVREVRAETQTGMFKCLVRAWHG